MTDSTDRTQFDEALHAATKAIQLEVTDAQREKLWEHRRLVIETNATMNLTRITEPADFAVKHVADSLAVARWCQHHDTQVRRVLDVGTGAGVPAIPLAILRPDWHITALDGTGKKTAFVSRTVEAMGLSNVTALQGRAETWGGETPFDLVLFKAVSSVERCIRFAKRHTAQGGHVVVYQTPQSAENELTEALPTATRLGFAPAAPFQYGLPLRDETLSRVLLIFRRTSDRLGDIA